jgi:abhydrolase domain-containing protein 12
LSEGSTSNIHILAIDYRGFGLSTGFPTEDGLITDGFAAVDWALSVAQVSASRIVILGQSLGTAVTAGVVERFAQRGVDFAGVVLVAGTSRSEHLEIAAVFGSSLGMFLLTEKLTIGFTNIPDLLTKYSIAGYLPILSPIGPYPKLKKILRDHVVDAWPSDERIANFVRLSQKVRLFIIHSKNDPEIPWTESEALFAAAANATTDGGMEIELFKKMKARSTVDMGNGAFVSTWRTGDDKIIREEIVSYGRKFIFSRLHGHRSLLEDHSRILTYAPVSLAALKAFDFDG